MHYNYPLFEKRSYLGVYFFLQCEEFSKFKVTWYARVNIIMLDDVKTFFDFYFSSLRTKFWKTSLGTFYIWRPNVSYIYIYIYIYIYMNISLRPKFLTFGLVIPSVIGFQRNNKNKNKIQFWWRLRYIKRWDARVTVYSPEKINFKCTG
jgi:hypothetical protein